MTHLGSGVGFAASSAVTGISTDTTSVEVGAGVTEAARGQLGPTETKLLAVRGKHGVLALGHGCKLCRWSA